MKKTSRALQRKQENSCINGLSGFWNRNDVDNEQLVWIRCVVVTVLNFAKVYTRVLLTRKYFNGDQHKR